MKTEIYDSYSAFLARADKNINGVSASFAADYPAYEKQNETNKACWGCSGCSGCSDCSDLKNAKPVAASKSAKSWFDVPKIKNIHTQVLKAVSQPGALDMSDWHKCTTTHCRGGWVVTLAGEKGKALEAASSTLFAAMQIYRASSPVQVSPVRFFETDAVAVADMERCAAEEAKL